MKILVVGGTGMIGGHAALHLAALGHEVTIAGRKPAQPGTPLVDLPYLQGDYVAETFMRGHLAPFESIVFAAGHDIRHQPEGADFGEHVLHANGVAVPRFAGLAKSAGVRRFVHVGSFYPHVAPELVETNAYVRSRKLATDGILALADDTFDVVGLDAPFVVGTVPGMSLPMFEVYTRYAQGKLDGMQVFGPAGSTNFISTLSLSEAIAGALERAQSGRAYLLGDENLSFADYFGLFFRAAGSDTAVPSLDQEHPLLPDSAIYTGRGNRVAYEPDADDAARLGYRRGDITRAVEEIVRAYA
ncbi:MAG: NAD-dependent epimerase/dehydratase family protein [Novosphingobium sp.]